MKRVIIVLVLCFCASSAIGTQQAPEQIVYEKQMLSFDDTPLEDYFNKNNPKPEEVFETGSYSTGCWRLYIGTWCVKEGQLCLKSLVHEPPPFNKPNKQIPLSAIFKNQKAPIPATWFSGVLCCYQRKMLNNPHSGLYCESNKDIYLVVKKGRVTSTHVVDNLSNTATRSREDWKWVLQASEPVKDDRQWIDARLIAKPDFMSKQKSSKSFVTRGILCPEGPNPPAHLYIPSTPMSKLEWISLYQLPEKYKTKYHTHVEIKGHFEKVDNRRQLHIDSIRPLKPGETIHQPEFKPAEKISKTSKKS